MLKAAIGKKTHNIYIGIAIWMMVNFLITAKPRRWWKNILKVLTGKEKNDVNPEFYIQYFLMHKSWKNLSPTILHWKKY